MAAADAMAQLLFLYTSTVVAALATDDPLKTIVIHANNAHEPYCSRYEASTEPYHVPCDRPNAQDLMILDQQRTFLPQ